MSQVVQSLTGNAQDNPQLPQFTFRGANLRLQTITQDEVVLAGPAETGKTLAALKFLDTLARTYAGARGALIRKMRSDMASTVLALYKQLFVEPAGDVRTFGGENVEWFEYPNRTRVWVAGIDRPGKVLSGALDFVYVNQAEELSLEDWEYLSTRTTGRAGVLIPGRLIGDCNPSHAQHWILQRERAGKLVKLDSRHEDNPTLFDEDGKVTPRGAHTLAKLEALTGVRKERLRYGRWVNAEGVVYENYDPALHLIDEMPRGWHSWRKVRSIDFGFTNPFSCSWWAIDGDGRMYRYRQLYMTQRTVRVHAQQIVELSRGEQIEGTICDHDAEDRATLAENGIINTPARKEISVGIERVTERLKVAGDGKPRIFFLRGALVERDEALAEKRKPLCTEDELLVYAYPKAQDGKPIKEVPLDMDNHGCDEMRYAVMYVDSFMTGQLFF